MTRTLAVALPTAAALLVTADELREATTRKVIDFSTGSGIWPAINDAVMGGVSTGEMVAADGYASFRGTVSFDNNGGFASVRSLPDRRDLSGFEGLVIRVRGDGKRYGLRLRTDASLDGVSYQVTVSPPAGRWVDIPLPFADFEPVYRGRVVPDHPDLDPSRITTFGLIIARQEGPFRLDISSIHACSSAACGEADP